MRIRSGETIARPGVAWRAVGPAAATARGTRRTRRADGTANEKRPAVRAWVRDARTNANGTTASATGSTPEPPAAIDPFESLRYGRTHLPHRAAAELHRRRSVIEHALKVLIHLRKIAR